MPKEQAVDVFNKEYAYKGYKCDISNVKDGYVKYYINPTEQMSSDFEDWCYGFTDKLEHAPHFLHVI